MNGLLSTLLARPTHRRGCRGEVHVPPHIRKIEELVNALILLKEEYAFDLDACARVDFTKSKPCPPNVKCLACSLDRVESALYRERGPGIAYGLAYDVLDCCIQPRPVVRQGTMKSLNAIADTWELPLPFPDVRRDGRPRGGVIGRPSNNGSE